MQFSTIADQIPFIGRKKHQRDVFWNQAQNQMRFLYNVAFRYVGNRYDAEDLVQETLYTACNKFHRGTAESLKAGCLQFCATTS